MSFVWISEQTAITSLYSINWLIFITKTVCVYCAVRTGSLNFYSDESQLLKCYYVRNLQGLNICTDSHDISHQYSTGFQIILIMPKTALMMVQTRYPRRFNFTSYQKDLASSSIFTLSSVWYDVHQSYTNNLLSLKYAIQGTLCLRR